MVDIHKVKSWFMFIAFFLVVMFSFNILSSSQVSAQAKCPNGSLPPDGDVANCAAATPAGACDSQKNILGIPTWYKYLATEIDSTGKCSPVLSGSDTEGRVNSALPIGLAVLEMFLRISGLVAVAMVFVGGFKFITSEGNPENAKGAKSTVINALIGLSIVILSTGVVSFIGNRLG